MGDTNPNFYAIEGTRPRWMGEYAGGRNSVLPIPAKVEPSQFGATDAVVVKVGANAGVDAVNVTVAALGGPIPQGAIIPIGAANSKKFIVTAAPANAGAVSLTTQPLATAVVANDQGTYLGIGKKTIPSGTLIGRTYAERDAGANFGPADVANDDEIYLTAREIADAAKDNDTELYRHEMSVKENFLPNWANLGSTVKAKIRSLYTCYTGAK